MGESNRKKLLNQLKKEVTDLEWQIKHSRLINFKINTIKNLKISARAMQRIAPYVLTAGIIAGGCKFIGLGWPFYGGDIFKQNSNVMKQFDNLGNIRYEQQYDEFKDSYNILYYYSAWQQNSDGLYSRYIETYDLGELTEKHILELFDKKGTSLSDILGTPISKIKETKNNITEEDLQQNGYIQARIYYEDTHDYIIYQESIGDNVTVTILYILVTIIAELIPGYIRHEISSFDFEDCVSNIKRKHKPIDLDVLKNQLEIKQENYKRLVR